MNACEISIIVPVFNSEKYLKELLDSILLQSFQDFEVIICNDGSTDKSQEIIDQYVNIDNRFFSFMQSNQGQSSARNNALKFVKGKYIAFIDSDDIISKEYLLKLYNSIQPDKDVSICSFTGFNSETKKTVCERKSEEWNIMFEEGISHVFQYSPCARLIKTDFLKKYDLRFSEGEQLEDGPYCMAMGLLANSVGIVNTQEYFYRIHSKSTIGAVRCGYKPKVPYNGLESAISTVLMNTNDVKKKMLLEYCSAKIMTGWLTNMYCNCEASVHKEITDYCYRIISEYFPDLHKNPYLFHINKNGKNLPLYHRLAVTIFALSYKTHSLYFFSRCTIFFLNFIRKIGWDFD